jgi:hypothetical protein
MNKTEWGILAIIFVMAGNFLIPIIGYILVFALSMSSLYIIFLVVRWLLSIIFNAYYKLKD